MTDLTQWIYAEDIAKWLSSRPPLDTSEQMDCILSAPHRTLTEKLEGLRKLQEEGSDPRVLKTLEKYLDLGEYLEEQLQYTKRMFHELYETDIFYHGCRESLLEKQMFRAPMEGIEYLKRQIEERAAQCETGMEEYFGVLYGFRDQTTKRLEHRWSFVMNFKGEVLYCLPEHREYRGVTVPVFGTMDSHYIKLPYASGTLVELTENPFFPSLKGILVNEAEPWEGAFDKADQWLLYPDYLHDGSSTGIGILPLDDYASITFGADFLLPFRQFLRRYEGELSEEERWLSELGRLVEEDKCCICRIMKDSQPKGSPEPYKKAQRYVKKLAEQMRGECKE